MSGCFLIMKRRSRRSRVADENMGNRREGNGNRGYSVANFGCLWFMMKAPLLAISACFINNDSQASSMTEEEEEGGDWDSAEIYGDNRRNARLRLWFANDPDLTERNYLAVQSSMRYAIHM